MQNSDSATISPKRKLTVTIKKWHGVAKWTWGCGEGEGII